MKSAIVVGAGMVGVATALHLQRRGWSVALVDRKAPGQETSYGNTGIIQSEALRPYPMPRDWSSLARIVSGRSNDVHYFARSLPHHIGPLLQYWWNSFPRRYARISAAYAQIISRATAAHEELISQSGAASLIRRNGYRVLHREQGTFDADVAAAESLHKEYGVRFAVLSSRDLAGAEPALRETGVGGLHWQEPWTVSDPGALVAAYAELFVRQRGTLLRGNAEKLLQTRGGWSIDTASGRIDAEAAVVALGPWSPQFLKRLGYRFPMVRKRGYHRHYAAPDPLHLPLRDATFGYVMTPMANGLRITTAAELSGPDAKPTPVQLGRAEAVARKVINLGSGIEADPWLGTRPCMPDMLPVLGPAARHRGLWMHFGHGHQGFTLGPVTGRILTDLMSGEPPLVEATAYRPDRF